MSKGIPARAFWWSTRRVGDQDIGRQLGLVGPAAWGMFTLYAATTLVLAFLFGRPTISTPLGVCVLAALLLAALLLVSPSRTPLSLWRTLVVIVVVIAAVVLITWQQDFHDRPPGYEAWELGSGNFLLFATALRGRVLAAWIGELGLVGAVCVWSWQVTASPAYGFGFVYGQPVSLIAGTIFAVALHTTASRVIEFRKVERERVAREARESALSRVQDAELHLVRALAEPTLRRIAAGEVVDRNDTRILEAALRDLIRGRALAIEPLAGALNVSRHRGVDIVVLDDLGESRVSASSLARAAQWCATEIRASSATNMTLRIVAIDRNEHGHAIVTISMDGRAVASIELHDSQLLAMVE